jgi:hypothetical protein
MTRQRCDHGFIWPLCEQCHQRRGLSAWLHGAAPTATDHVLMVLDTHPGLAAPEVLRHLGPEYGPIVEQAIGRRQIARAADGGLTVAPLGRALLERLGWTAAPGT